MTRWLLIVSFAVVGCPAPPSGPEPLPVEPIRAPQDQGAPGVPVGIRTVLFEDQTLEVWYPAPDSIRGSATLPLDVAPFVPAAFTERVGDVALASIPSIALREAPPRRVPEPVPVLLFSHGFGGFRTQSATLCAHLASRGYVVVAADHPGRMLGDVLPCLFDPPLDGCELGGFVGDDVGIDDMLAARRWVQQAAGSTDSFLSGLADATTLGIFGHSAGGGTAMELGGMDPSLSAILSMAAPAGTEADKPSAILGGRCDPFADPPSLEAALAGLTDGAWVDIGDAGHMPFADICPIGLGAIAEDLLRGRPDIDETFLDGLLDLATSGCSDVVPPADPPCGAAFRPLDDTFDIIENYATRFFDQALKGEGPGLEAGLFDDVDVHR